MYNKADKILSNDKSLANYIEDFDVFNSRILYLMANPNLEKVKYEITVHEYRPDLIAADIYGSDTYLDILLVQLGGKLSNLKRGIILEVLPKDTVDYIIRSL